MKRFKLKSTLIGFYTNNLIDLCDFFYKIFFYLFSCVCEFLYWILLLMVMTEFKKASYFTTSLKCVIDLFILIDIFFSKDSFISLKMLIFIKNDLSFYFFYLGIDVLSFESIDSLTIDMIAS